MKGDGSMGLRTLTPSTQNRILVPQPLNKKGVRDTPFFIAWPASFLGWWIFLLYAVSESCSSSDRVSFVDEFGGRRQFYLACCQGYKRFGGIGSPFSLKTIVETNPK
jgi:hypothetical protein